MTSLIIRTAVNAGALLLIANLSSGEIVIDNFIAALIAAVVLGLANAVVKPILYAVAKSMTCVLSCITLGLWSLFLSWLISGLLFWATAKYLPGFEIRNDSFLVAMLGALALSIVNALATVLTRQDEDKDKEK